MSIAKYRHFHLFVLINILSQLIVPFSETYSAVLEKADHPYSSAVHEFGTFFSAGKYEVRQKPISNFHQGTFLRPKGHFEILFVCCHDLRNELKFYQMILSLNDYKTEGAGWGLPKEQGLIS